MNGSRTIDYSFGLLAEYSVPKKSGSLITVWPNELMSGKLNKTIWQARVHEQLNRMKFVLFIEMTVISGLKA